MGIPDRDKYNLRKFGITMGAAFAVIAILVHLRQRHSPLPWLLLSMIFLAPALIWPRVLKPLYVFWMKLALVLAWINTRLILSLMFYLAMAPIGLAVKLLGIDLLERKIDPQAGSYWKNKKDGAFKPADYERQF